MHGCLCPVDKIHLGAAVARREIMYHIFQTRGKIEERGAQFGFIGQKETKDYLVM